MEKQMKAERERRAKILDAEGEKRSAILIAEGEKESAVLRAEAVKETKIREAQGEAEAVLTVQRAVADAIKLMNEANPSEQVIAIKSLEAFEKAADGKATKIIIPSNIQSLAGLATSLKELVVDTPLLDRGLSWKQRERRLGASLFYISLYSPRESKPPPGRLY